MSVETPLQALDRGAAALGVTLSSEQLAQFEQFLAELRKWNRRFNLTGATDLHELVSRHVLDSLGGLVALKDLRPGAEVADLGSGAGFPGLPIKIARPDLRVTLIEPRQKRAAFLSTACALLRLQDTIVSDTRLSPKHPPADLVGRFSSVLMRAVTDPSEAKALATPLLRAGGRLVIWVSEQQAERLEGEFLVHRYVLPGTRVTSALLIAEVPAESR